MAAARRPFHLDLDSLPREVAAAHVWRLPKGKPRLKLPTQFVYQLRLSTR